MTHYTLHLPATLSKEQLTAIQNMAKTIVNNEPFVTIHENYLQFLLRVAMSYRDTLIEFDEDKRWSVEDEGILNTLLQEFKPLADWIIEQYKIKRRELEG